LAQGAKERKTANEFLEFLVKRADVEGKEVRKRIEELINGGKSKGAFADARQAKDVEFGWGSQTVKSAVKINDVETWIEGESEKSKLRILVRAEVDGVKGESTFTFFRGFRDEVLSYTYARAGAPGGRGEDAERIAAVVKAMTEKEPAVNRRKDRKIVIECFGLHLKGFKKYEKGV